MTAAFEPPACSNTIFTGPTPDTHQIVRTPLPYGSPSAPACVMSERTFAAVTGCGNAGTVTFSWPRYVDELVTSAFAPPVLDHDAPLTSGSERTGDREPQITWYQVLVRLLPQRLADEQRIGNCDGGAVLDQSVLTRPEDVSWNTIVPSLSTASSGFPSSAVVQPSVNDAPFCSLTVTFSVVGVVL